jgi:hypothetical protein
MHIVVCIKQVPDSAHIRVHPVTHTIMRQGIPAIINPYDLFAIEAALRLKDQLGGRVTVMSMGPNQAEPALRKAISLGCDDAILVTDRIFAGADTLATSYVLASAIRTLDKEMPVSLVFTCEFNWWMQQIGEIVQRVFRSLVFSLGAHSIPGSDLDAIQQPQELYKSLTWDRGTEMAAHKRFTLATDIKVYFCDPYHPWQRGTNENTNGLLRQYFPKGIDLSVYSQAKLNAVARKLNERPRKTLNYETPAERFHQSVASTS